MNASIIIPTYNGKALLQKNLPAVMTAMKEGDELLIVDDCSTDDTVAWLQKEYSLTHDECLPDQKTGDLPADLVCYSSKPQKYTIRVIVNAKNERFGISCNRGVKEARYEVIVLFNNDVSPEPNCIEFLLPHFDVSTMFAVGCKELASAEGNKEYGRNEGEFRRGFFVHRRCDDQNQTSTAWVVGGSGAFRRSQWIELGGFDPAFKPAYGEDIDLSFRARQKGWQVAFEPRAVVHHNHESTNVSVFGKKEIEIVSFKNSILFMWKTAPLKEKIFHFLWLPYHLVFTTLRSRGNFLFGFIRAVKTIVGVA